MSYTFEGQSFATLAAFQKAFPVYRGYCDLIKEGVTTVQELEKRIHIRHVNARAAALKSARSNNTFRVSRKEPNMGPRK